MFRLNKQDHNNKPKKFIRPFITEYSNPDNYYDQYYYNLWYSEYTSPLKIKKVIRPNMFAYLKKVKTFLILSFFAGLMFFCFFAVCAVNRNDLYRLFIIGFILSAILFTLFARRFYLSKALVGIINQIKGKEKVKISNLTYKTDQTIEDKGVAVRYLIISGNLKDYVINGDYVQIRNLRSDVKEGE
jgi:hypothetical protein